MTAQVLRTLLWDKLANSISSLPRCPRGFGAIRPRLDSQLPWTNPRRAVIGGGTAGPAFSDGWGKSLLLIRRDFPNPPRLPGGKSADF